MRVFAVSGGWPTFPMQGCLAREEGFRRVRGPCSLIDQQGLSSTQPSRKRLLLAGIMGVALIFHLWGINRDLPYVTEDLTVVFNPGLRIAASGDLNPRRFQHPGSTIVYPLAAALHAWNAIAYGGSWWHADAALQRNFRANQSRFVLLGRLVTVAFALLSVPIIYKVGALCFCTEAGLIGALLAALHPSEVFDKQVRTDSASLLFTMLALLCCIQLFRQRTVARQIAAGAAIGLAIGTKYYLGALVAVLVAVDAAILWDRKSGWLAAGVGLAAVALGFALCTPYFFWDFATAAKDLHAELRTSHVGADGLSPTENFLFYLRTLPQTVGWPQVCLSAGGMVLAGWELLSEAFLLFVFVMTFMVGICSSSLHWARWLVPILPVFALCAGHALCRGGAFLCRFGPLPRLAQHAVLGCAIAVALAQPLWRLVEADRTHSNPSTYVQARKWVEENLPAGSAIAYEWDTLPPPLAKDDLSPGTWINRDHGCNLTEASMSWLSVRGSPSFYAQHGFHYLVTSSLMYADCRAAPERYPAQAAFYGELLAKGRLLHQVDPSPTTEGSQIRIYEFR